MRRPHVSTALSTAPPRTTRVTSVILLTMSLGVLIAQIDTSVVNLAVRQIGVDLGASVNTLQWVVDAYNLVYASLLLTAGTLADLYGRRKYLFKTGLRVGGYSENADGGMTWNPPEPGTRRIIEMSTWSSQR